MKHIQKEKGQMNQVIPVTKLERMLAEVTTPSEAESARETAKRCAEAAKLVGMTLKECNRYNELYLCGTWKLGDLVKDIRPGNQSNTDDTLKIGTKRQRQYARRFRKNIEYDRIPEYARAATELEEQASIIGCIRWGVPRPSDPGSVEPPKGTYDAIVVDPPWPMQKIQRDVRPRQVGLDYQVMSIDEIKAVTIPAAPDCHLWLWTTHKFLPAAFEVLEAWGFKYVCTFVWCKAGGPQPINLPQYTCEFALYARRGAPKFATTKSFDTWFQAARGKHSEKPIEFYEMVRRVTGSDLVLDMYNRRDLEGIEGWGAESGRLAAG